jgi:hypothetical protein
MRLRAVGISLRPAEYSPVSIVSHRLPAGAKRHAHAREGATCAPGRWGPERTCARSACASWARRGDARDSAQRKKPERPAWRVTARGPRGAEPARSGYRRMARDMQGSEHLVRQVIRRAKRNPISFRDESARGAWSPDACALNVRAGATGARLRESRQYDARSATGWELRAAPCGDQVIKVGTAT